MVFEKGLIALESLGLLDALLPFLLFFTIIYGILLKAKIFGEERKSPSVVVALVVSLLTVIPHVTGTYPANWDPIIILNRLLSGVTAIMIALVTLAIVVGLFGASGDDLRKTPHGLFSVFFFILINIFVYMTYPYLSPIIVNLSVIILLFYHFFVPGPPGITAYIPASIVIVFIILLRDATFVKAGHLPSWLLWAESPTALVAVTAIGIALLLIKWVTFEGNTI